ncbi:hypothetical protein EHQ12_10410 [Leptospira gomenensis]|uniref:Uncharacterized protein n=1 Tax=Leptospira gomenensis TaxID=2484974 RepID=A0A5F1YDU7_9LEPT|nr:hypothetical protein [Leptospira gomenensis]TGK36436.1 hypothetical protein EHQ17_03975 [Leptospira gomenensis]TGK38265.1 hypothetical protein EHQ12_10410 [Leptospira gomenensis]TGK46006.1 hypothetical protein EHQ07_07535 [Leptospira gomenensis]TGK65270.1 hypothetical protein EHQ13_05340 [Leptospira gomenensis]
MSDVSGKIKYGCLWGMLTPFITFFLAVGVTIFLLKEDYGKARSIADWTLLAGKHILLFGGIVISVVVALILGLWFAIKDSKPIETVRIFWPLFIILVYWIAPNFVPGPVDDSFVTLCVGSYQIYRYFKERNAGIPTEPPVKRGGPHPS